MLVEFLAYRRPSITIRSKEGKKEEEEKRMEKGKKEKEKGKIRQL